MLTQVLGNGVYTIREAARLIGVQPQRVSAWFQGWPRRGEALLRSDYADLFASLTISFLDFVDAAVAVTLRDNHSVSSHTVRRLRDKLADQWSTRHPFSREEFYTDDTGREVFCTLATENGETGLLEILRQQWAMPNILLPFLKRVEYSRETHMAQVFTLMDRVILDPRRKFGKPIVVGTGMRTSILSECFDATNSYDVVADWYGVEPDDVRAAVAFERDYAGLAA